MLQDTNFSLKRSFSVFLLPIPRSDLDGPSPYVLRVRFGKMALLPNSYRTNTEGHPNKSGLGVDITGQFWTKPDSGPKTFFFKENEP